MPSLKDLSLKDIIEYIEGKPEVIHDGSYAIGVCGRCGERLVDHVNIRITRKSIVDFEIGVEFVCRKCLNGSS